MRYTILAAILAASPAISQDMRCGERERVLSNLATKYGETRKTAGMGPKGLVETFASEETGSWTITISHPNGITCIVAAGTGFEAIAQGEAL